MVSHARSTRLAAARRRALAVRRRAATRISAARRRAVANINALVNIISALSIHTAPMNINRLYLKRKRNNANNNAPRSQRQRVRA